MSSYYVCRCFLFLLLLSDSYFLFFFYYYVHHRDLHSFPTRRSSDLRAVPDRRALRRPKRGARVPPLATGPRPTEVLEHRSEEHTSELQSRPHLVCRLLLEKKKKTKTNTAHHISRTC